MTREYEKKYIIRTFEEGDLVSVVVPKKNRGLMDNRRVLGRVHKVCRFHYYYLIQTPYSILDQKYLITDLLPLPETTVVDFSGNIINEVGIAKVASHGSMHEELGPKCKCKGNCIFKHCACKKSRSFCTDKCHGKGRSSAVCKNEAPLETSPEVIETRGRKRAATATQTVGEGQMTQRRMRRG